MRDIEPDMSGKNASPVQEQSVANTTNANMLSYIAIGLSVLALFVSVLEVSYLHDEVRSQAWPYLQLNMRYSEEGFELNVINKGVGPAKVRSVKMFLDDNEVTDIDQAILDTVGPENAFSYELYFSRNPAPGVMSADEKAVFFKVPWQPNTRLLTQSWANRIDLTACYCSVYDQCWVSRMGQGDPVKTEYCE